MDQNEKIKMLEDKIKNLETIISLQDQLISKNNTIIWPPNPNPWYHTTHNVPYCSTTNDTELTDPVEYRCSTTITDIGID